MQTGHRRRLLASKRAPKLRNGPLRCLLLTGPLRHQFIDAAGQIRLQRRQPSLLGGSLSGLLPSKGRTKFSDRLLSCLLLRVARSNKLVNARLQARLNALQIRRNAADRFLELTTKRLLGLTKLSQEVCLRRAKIAGQRIQPRLQGSVTLQSSGAGLLNGLRQALPNALQRALDTSNIFCLGIPCQSLPNRRINITRRGIRRQLAKLL